MKEQKQLRSVGVHDGSFHADEVTACALLILFNLVDRDKVVRTRDLKVLSNCEYVCDVGGVYAPEQHLFDHHQADYRGLLSSAGMILLYLHEQGILSKKEYDFFNSSLIIGVDDHDNGRSPQLDGYAFFSHVISNFAPIPYEVEPAEGEKAFHEALDFTLGHLTRLWERYQYNQECRAMVAEVMERSQLCLIFDEGIAWQDSFFELGGEEHPALFVIMPTGKHWKLRGIPPTNARRMDVRCPLPAEWAGLLDDALKHASGIEGALFCHKGRFTSVWKTKQDALQALDFVLSSTGNKR